MLFCMQKRRKELNRYDVVPNVLMEPFFGLFVFYVLLHPQQVAGSFPVVVKGFSFKELIRKQGRVFIIHFNNSQLPLISLSTQARYV